MIAACAARHWLARSAAGVKLICSRTKAAAPACASLVSCLPALGDAELCLPAPLSPGNLKCLLDALAWCPRLRALSLSTYDEQDADEVMPPFSESGCACAFATLRSLTRLALSFEVVDPYTLADVVDVLVPLTGLAELTISLPKPAVVPAALAQLKGLRSLNLQRLDSCFFEAGCLNLPSEPGVPLLSQFPLALTQLVALECLSAGENRFAELPAGITALSRLTELTLGRAGRFSSDPLQQQWKRPLDVRALADLSGFPALCKLTFEYCEVTMCTTMLGAAWHKSLTSLDFITSHPAPECALMVLQLRQALKQVNRGSVLRFGTPYRLAERGLADARALPPSVIFNVALLACGLLEGLEGGWT